MRLIILATVALFIVLPASAAAMPMRPGPGAWNHWGYSGHKLGFICIIPPPPQRDRVSDTTLILSLDQSVKQKTLASICRKYHLKLLYDYQNFSMAAVAADHPLSDGDMEALIQKLSQEPGVLGVERDRIMQLDGAREE